MGIRRVCCVSAVLIQANSQFLCEGFYVWFYKQRDVIGMDGMNIHTALRKHSPAQQGVPGPFCRRLGGRSSYCDLYPRDGAAACESRKNESARCGNEQEPLAVAA